MSTWTISANFRKVSMASSMPHFFEELLCVEELVDTVEDSIELCFCSKCHYGAMLGFKSNRPPTLYNDNQSALAITDFHSMKKHYDNKLRRMIKIIKSGVLQVPSQQHHDC
jgi:hypothetical protein